MAAFGSQQKLKLPLHHKYFTLVNKVGRGVAKNSQHTRNCLTGELVALFTSTTSPSGRRNIPSATAAAEMARPGGVKQMATIVNGAATISIIACIFRSPPDQPLLIGKATGQAVWQFYLPVATLDPRIPRQRGCRCSGSGFIPNSNSAHSSWLPARAGGVPLVCALQAAAYRQGILCTMFAIKQKAEKPTGQELDRGHGRSRPAGVLGR